MHDEEEPQSDLDPDPDSDPEPEPDDLKVLAVLWYRWRTRTSMTSSKALPPAAPSRLCRRALAVQLVSSCPSSLSCQSDLSSFLYIKPFRRYACACFQTCSPHIQCSCLVPRPRAGLSPENAAHPDESDTLQHIVFCEFVLLATALSCWLC